ncbi:MAG: aminoglycoside phosphotransferase family protein [Fimbriimonadaceae bacterium]|nr:aminoglycoside phosphotransferase family protein [Fimbriimonadaceae bacterium]
MFGACPIPTETLEAFLDAHGLPIGPLEPILGQAVVNWVFRVGDSHVLRISKPDIDDGDAYTEQVAVPAVRAAGIDTPELLVFDESRSVVDSVVTVYTQVAGVALGRIEVDQRQLAGVYRRLGEEVARIQLLVHDVPDPHGRLDPDETSDCRAEVQEAGKTGQIDALTEVWLSRWLDRLEPALQDKPPKVFAHQDLHAFNTMVTQDPLAFRCVIDWGDAGWADPTSDFTAVPIWAVPWMIEGFEAQGGVVDPGFIGRILWETAASLFHFRDHPGDEPWAPRNLSFWANLARLFRMDLDRRWHPWLPDAIPGEGS